MTLGLMDASDCVSAPQLLARTREARRERDEREAELAVLALAWAHRHIAGQGLDGTYDAEPFAPHPGVERPEDLESVGIPEIAWHASGSFAAALGMSTAAGRSLLRDVLVLSERLPRVWARVSAVEVPVWRARRVAQAVLGEPDDVCAFVDTRAAPVADKLGAVALDRIVDAAQLALHAEERELEQCEALDARFVTLHEHSINHMGIADMSLRGDWADVAAFDDAVGDVAAALGREGAPTERESLDVRRSMAVGILADPARALALLAGDGAPPAGRTRSLGLVVHLSEANLLGLDPVAIDAAGRPYLATVITDWARRIDLRPHVQPVIHCGGCADCAACEDRHPDSYTPSAAERAAVVTRDRRCMFPFCERPSSRCDCDHQTPFDKGGPTCRCNLTPLCRHHHRLKTHAGWTYVSVEPGVYLWHDRYRQSFLRTRDGTTDLTERDRAVPALP